jgi:hypothetical protein
MTKDIVSFVPSAIGCLCWLYCHLLDPSPLSLCPLLACSELLLLIRVCILYNLFTKIVVETRVLRPTSMGSFMNIKYADMTLYWRRERWWKFHRSRGSFMGIKLFCTVSIIWACWKLRYEIPTETGLRPLPMHARSTRTSALHGTMWLCEHQQSKDLFASSAVSRGKLGHVWQSFQSNFHVESRRITLYQIVFLLSDFFADSIMRFSEMNRGLRVEKCNLASLYA